MCIMCTFARAYIVHNHSNKYANKNAKGGSNGRMPLFKNAVGVPEYQQLF